MRLQRAARTADLAAHLEEEGFRTAFIAAHGGFRTVSVPPGWSVEEALRRLAALPEVAAVEPDQPVWATYVPNDPLWSDQWNFQMVGAHTAWDVLAQALGAARRGGDPSVVVAVVDTGVAYEDYGPYRMAPDFAGTRFVPGYDFVENDSHPNDDNGHGTHVAGTIAESTDNFTGAAGIAHGVSLMPIKVLDSVGSGSQSRVSDAIYWAVDHGADVINLSLGGDQTTVALRDALEYARAHEVVVVAAAGNNGPGVLYPARYNDLCISVGAVDRQKKHAFYSNSGPELDLVAPGGGGSDGIVQQTFQTRNVTEFGYIGKIGTSMATPHVSGAAALLKSLGVSSPDEVERLLVATAQDLGAAGRDDLYGNGLLRAGEAVAAALGVSPPPDSNGVDGIVVDDGDPGTAQEGYWTTASSPRAHGGDHRTCVGLPGDRYRWEAPLPSPGTYDVYLWWVDEVWKSSRARVRVGHAGGVAELSVDQTRDGGRWNRLGEWTFAGGGDGWVEVTGENGRASADAVRFVQVGDAPPPTVNRAPVAVDDAAVTGEGEPVTVSVLANDSDPDGDRLTVEGTTPATSGLVTFGTRSVTYAPAPGFVGTDRFGYTVEDGRGGTATAAVTVTVVPSNRAPIALDDAVEIAQGDAADIRVLDNDQDPDGDALSISDLTQPSGGTASVNPDGTVHYASEPRFAGTDGFTYVVTDGNGGTDTAAVTVVVVPAAGGGPDPGGATPGVEIVVDDGEEGASAEGVWFTSRAAGGYGGDSLECVGFATDRHRWTPQLPVAGEYDVYLRWVADRWRSTRVPVAVGHAEGVSDLFVDQTGAGGQWNLLGSWRFEAGAAGWVEVTGGGGKASADAVRFVLRGEPPAPTPTPNAAPVAVDDAAATIQGVPVDVDVLANDADPDGDPIELWDVTQASNGTVAVNDDGSVRYRPAAVFTGVDRFAYTVADGRGATDTATVTVSVVAEQNGPSPAPEPAPEPPPDPVPGWETALDDRDPGTSMGGVWLTSRVPGGYRGDNLECVGFATDWYRWTPDLPASGVYDVHLWWAADRWRSSRVPVTVAHAGGMSELTVDQTVDGGRWNYLGSWSFDAGTGGWVEITGRSGRASADAVRFVLRSGGGSDPGPPPPEPPENQPPHAVADAVSTVEGRTVTVDVLSNDSDPEGGALTVQAVTQGAYGTTSLQPDGTVEYTPNPGFTGRDGFSYAVADPQGASATAQVAVAVEPAPPGDPGGQPPTDPDLPEEVVVDDGEEGTSSGGFWFLSAGAQAYGGDSQVCVGFATDWYRWTPDLPSAGLYEVYLWWQEDPWRSRSAPVIVRHARGEEELAVDQTQGGGRWQRLGSWEFDAGTQGWVEITGKYGKVSADAVRFVRVP
ncbi:MAG: hypothetical protein Kow0092_21660 [Deferrisomatales bacterium]